MSNPYENLPPSRYWKSGVANAHPLHVTDFYKKKFAIDASDKIATAGSCFAQHVARHMRAKGYQILDVEPPLAGTSEELAQKFGYRTYSARYGNIYTSRQLLQLMDDCQTRTVRDEDIWERGGRFFDALRPAVEPNGLPSANDVREHRQRHLQKVTHLFANTDVLVFTLGLTESWINMSTKTVYPTCPGVVAGTFDPEKYQFVNFDFNDVLKDMTEVRRRLKKRNPNLRILLTVSPVPLTATAADEHILLATTYSKSVLRAVAGSMSKQFDDVDYFPSYELIAAPFSRGFFYESNMRSVTNGGVETVMKCFFSEHQLPKPTNAPDKGSSQKKSNADVVCEEALLEAFSS